MAEFYGFFAPLYKAKTLLVSFELALTCQSFWMRVFCFAERLSNMPESRRRSCGSEPVANKSALQFSSLILAGHGGHGS